MTFNFRILKSLDEWTDAGTSFWNGFRQNRRRNARTNAANEFRSGSRPRSISTCRSALGSGSLPGSVSGEGYGKSYDVRYSERSESEPERCFSTLLFLITGQPARPRRPKAAARAGSCVPASATSCDSSYTFFNPVLSRRH